MWGARDWRLLAELEGHEGKLMGCDWGPGGSVLSVGFDRTLKRWADEGLGF